MDTHIVVSYLLTTVDTESPLGHDSHERTSSASWGGVKRGVGVCHIQARNLSLSFLVCTHQYALRNLGWDGRGYRLSATDSGLRFVAADI